MTPPPVLSVPPASDGAAEDGLRWTGPAIFDRDAVRGALETAFLDAHTPAEIRKATVLVLKDAITRGRAFIQRAFESTPTSADAAVRGYSFLMDCVVTTVLDVARTKLHPLANPTDGERLSVLAVGGYGRAEMAPHSDVDLLFLTPYKITPWAESLIESMLYMFWDLHLKVGHASRTVRDCIRLGREDYTIRTALLEHRHLGGDRDLADELTRRLWSELYKGTASQFIEAKLEERKQRHKKQGARYVVEPNVKEGKGGLRDLQTLFWIAKYVDQVSDREELVKHGLLSQDEFDQFVSAESFLTTVRTHLHLVTNRAMDQLTFDLQVEVAKRMGYSDHSGRRGVEHFMQDYFRQATIVGDLTRIVLTGLEANHVKTAPSLVGLFRRKRAVKDGFEIQQNRINISDPAAFLADNRNILRLFDEALRAGYLIHPDAMRLVAANLHLIDDEMRADPAANKAFLDLMLKHGNPERALRRMNELGVLAAFLPEFAPVVAMMQFNMYHHYTVDEHLIQCVKTLAQIEREELLEELPIASSILKNGLNRRVIYAAVFLHDIGKGRPEDHSVLGAKILRKLGPRLGLKKDDAETVEWLIRYHLLMSDMAQKRDIADPRTVRDFAKAVKTKKRLDLLTVLTVCDIRGVGPGVWNNWKAQLIRSLYRATASALENGLEDVNRESRESEAKRALRDVLADWPNAALRHETSRHYGPYWQGLRPAEHVIFARLLRDLGNDEVRIDTFGDDDRDATRVAFAMADHPGIFSRLAGALALVGANVVDARSYTSKDGFAMAVFWVQDAEGSPYEEARLPRLKSMIDRTLQGKVVATQAFDDKDKLKKRERPFKVETSIAFDNEGSEIYTIIEVDTRDRPGLLFDLTRTLAEANIQIASAVVATYGEQVVDSFYVKDMFGLKIHSAAKRAALEKKLRTAISIVAERASAL